MTQISIRTAALIMGRTPRTVWRRIADGALRVIGGHDDDRTRLALEDVVREACVRIEADDYALIVAANAGHRIAGEQIAAAREAAPGADPATLDALLERIERRTVLAALNDTAR